MNEKDKALLNFMNSLVIADTKTLSEIASAKGLWEADKAYPNVYKACNNLVAIGKLEKHPKFWRIPGCVSTYQEHSKLLSNSIASILKSPYQSIIYREKSIPVGLRLDCLCLFIREDMARCFAMEVLLTETESSYQQKKNVLESWEGATGFLSQLFNYVIPHFDIITSDELKPYLEGL